MNRKVENMAEAYAFISNTQRQKPGEREKMILHRYNRLPSQPHATLIEEEGLASGRAYNTILNNKGGHTLANKKCCTTIGIIKA